MSVYGYTRTPCASSRATSGQAGEEDAARTCRQSMQLKRLALQPPARGIHSVVSQLNLSDIYGIGGARRGSVARVKGGLGGVRGVKGVCTCQTRLSDSSC